MAQTAEGGQGRQVGNVTALTTLSPVRPARQRRLGRRLLAISLVPLLGRPLARLAFIHYASWTVIAAVPAADGSGARTPLESRYLLFESNYNGLPGDYFDAFADTLPHRLERLWGECLQFDETVLDAPGADGRVLAPWAFRDYIARNELEVLHYHAAYPEATVIDVRQALAAADRRRRAGRSDRRLAATAPRVVPLVIGPEPDAGSALGRARGALVAQYRALTRRYGVNQFLLLTPVDPSAAPERFERLRNWPHATNQSPLRGLDDTHYARLVLVPPEVKDLGQTPPDDLRRPYLLYSSIHKGSWREHVRRLQALGSVADEIWDDCPRYPGHTDPGFGDWAAGHRLRPRYYVPGYEPRTVDAVTRSLEQRSELGERLWEHGPTAAWLASDGGEAR
jgi:hypothetical protein